MTTNIDLIYESTWGARQAEQNEQPLTAEVQLTNILPCPVRVQHLPFFGVGYAGVADHLEAGFRVIGGK